MFNVQSEQVTESTQKFLIASEPKDVERITHLPGGKFPAGYKRLVSRTADGTSYYASETTSWRTQFRLPKLRLSLAGVPEDESKFPITLWFRRILLDSVQVLQLNSALMRQPTPNDSQRTFQIDGSNLPVVIAELKQNYPERFAWWVGHIQTILPDVEAVQIEEQASDRSLFLQLAYRNGLKVPARLLSDGTLRMLALTLIAYIQPDDSAIYMIEEPENGVHPKVIEGIFDSLSSVYDGQVFLATHSPLVLAQASPHNLLIFNKRDTGSAVIVRGSEHSMLENWKNELSLGSLFAAGVFE